MKKSTGLLLASALCLGGATVAATPASAANCTNCDPGGTVPGGGPSSSTTYQSGVVYVGQDRTFATWAAQPTTVCATALGTGSADGKYQWWSFTSSGNVEGIPAGQTRCMTKSFWGFGLKVHNWGYYPLRFTFPTGP